MELFLDFWAVDRVSHMEVKPQGKKCFGHSGFPQRWVKVRAFTYLPRGLWRESRSWESYRKSCRLQTSGSVETKAG